MDFTHGIVHTPASIASTTSTLLLETALNSEISKIYLFSTFSKSLIAIQEYVRLYWVDLSNTRRCRVLPKEYFKQLVQKSNRPGVTIAKVSLGLVYLHIADGFEPIGEFLYVLDLSSLRVLQGVGKGPILGILGNFEEKDPEGKKNGVEVRMCPRTALSRIIRFVWFVYLRTSIEN